MIESCEPNELFELGLPDLRRYGDVQAEARHAHECETVSYTHLDVYKRQRLPRPSHCR